MSNPTDSNDTGNGPKCCPIRRALGRHLGVAVDWIDDRTELRSTVCRLAQRPVPRGIRCGSLWPSMILFTFLVQAITGFFLWIFYSPSAQTAWESVYFLQYHVTGGWLLRGVHHYAAQVLVALTALYVIYLLVSGRYRAPRECVYWVAVLMGMFSLGLCLTGDLLAWDQNSYASTLVRVRFLMLLPWIGDDLFKVAAGGPAFGHLTLTRFFALHVGMFAGGFIVLLLLHGWVVHRAALKPEEKDREAGKPTVPYWPDRLGYHALSWLVVMVIIYLLVGGPPFSPGHEGELPGDHRGVELGAPADPDPANFYAAARPEWSFRGLYEFSNMFPGDAMPLVGVSWKIVPIFVVPGILVLLVLCFPFIARLKQGYWINLAVVGFLLVAITLLSIASWRHDARNAEHQAALAEAHAQAARVKQLARSPSGIPINGALWLLRNDPKTQGPTVYEKQCAVCHDYGAPGAEAITADPSSAPDLYGFAGRRWVAGLLDPDQVKGPKYYGNTRFASGTMVRYVEGPFAELEEEEQRAIVAALSAEARLASQSQIDQKDSASIAKGRELIVEHCARCHRFHDQGPLGPAPDLTGYGSHEWLMGIVIDPTHAWFYGQRNDRMPVYLEVPEEPAKNRLSAGDVSLVSRWLRGEWYEPSDPQAVAVPEETVTPDAPPMLTVGKWVARRVEPDPVPDTPVAQARALFQREHCAICHDCTGAPGGDIVAADPSAPDLGGFASRQWIAGLLDPDQVKTRKYFGNSKFRTGDMAGFVEEMLSDLDDEEKAELETLVMALSAEAQLPSQREMDQQDADRIGKGRELFSGWLGCTDCHRVHDEGTHVGPDLTGYGSAKWLAELICDPAKGASNDASQLRFYGDDNYGMPSYRKHRPEAIEGEGPEADKARKELEDQEGLNLLRAEEIQLLVDMLRDSLPEPKETGAPKTEP